MAVDRNRILKVLLTERVRIFSYIWAIVRDEHLAEDVFQEVSMLAMDKAEELEDAEAVGVWVLRAAKNKAMTAVRTRSRDRLVFSEAAQERLDEAWSEPAAHPAEHVIDALRRCLSELTPNAQKLVEMRYTRGLTGGKLADAVGKNLTAAYVAVSRINKTLAACVERRLSEGER